MRTEGNLTRRIFAALALGAIFPFAVVGCGGGGGKGTAVDTQRGVVRFALDWSATTSKKATRSLTPAANSVVVAVTDSSGFNDTRTVNRPAANQNQTIFLEFLALNAGRAQMTAQAFTGRNGIGDVVAESAAQYDLVRDQTQEKQVAFEIVYTRIIVSPDTATLNQGATLTFVAQGVLNNGTVTQPNPIGTWKSSDTAIATVDASGKVTAKQPGTATISFTDNFDRTGSATLTAQGGDAEVNIQ